MTEPNKKNSKTAERGGRGVLRARTFSISPARQKYRFTQIRKLIMIIMITMVINCPGKGLRHQKKCDCESEKFLFSPLPLAPFPFLFPCFVPDPENCGKLKQFNCLHLESRDKASIRTAMPARDGCVDRAPVLRPSGESAALGVYAAHDKGPPPLSIGLQPER